MSEGNSAIQAETAKVTTPKRDLLIYPMGELAGGIYKAYFSTYISLLMTSIYLFPIALAGVLESLQSIIGWVAAPAFGLFLDRFYFKKSKFYPWYIIGGAGGGVVYILIFFLPLVSKDPSKLALLVAGLIIIAAILAAAVGQAGIIIYAKLAKGPKERAYLASASKFTRDGMKVLVGAIFPIMLVAFTNLFGRDVEAWALTAVILAGTAIILYFVTAFIGKGSNFEKKQMAMREQQKQQIKKSGVILTLRSIFTNRALLIAFLAMVASKIFFFFHIMGGAFLWRYYMGNMMMMAAYMTAISLTAIIGAVVAVPLFMKFFKDTKKSYVIAFVIQLAIYACSLFIVSQGNPVGTIVIIAAASFFNGITDSLIMSLFAGATDYAKWKYGTTEVGLTMSCFSLSVTVAAVVSIGIRTSMLAAGGFDSVALAAGEAVPQGVINALFNMNTLYPMILCAAIVLLVGFLYPVNDKKLLKMRAEIDAGKTQDKE